jgi:hypothetical protein
MNDGMDEQNLGTLSFLQCLQAPGLHEEQDHRAEIISKVAREDFKASGASERRWQRRWQCGGGSAAELKLNRHLSERKTKWRRWSGSSSTGMDGALINQRGRHQPCVMKISMTERIQIYETNQDVSISQTTSKSEYNSSFIPPFTVSDEGIELARKHRTIICRGPEGKKERKTTTHSRDPFVPVPLPTTPRPPIPTLIPPAS